MISRIEGILERLSHGVAGLRCDHLTYMLLIPGADEQRLASRVGERIAFHTLHYLEGQGQGANYVPRLIGFSSPEDRAFFEIFTTVKGMGNRKALRALQLPFHRVAEAIAKKDIDSLKALPEIGARTAQTIVAELHGKVEDFVRLDRADHATGGEPGAAADSMADDALTVLVTLGEPKLAAMQLVERALAADPALDSTEALIAAVYRLKRLPV